MILVGRDRYEGGLGENVRAEGRVFGAKSVVLVGLDDVDPRLILVHGVQDDLWTRERTVGLGDGGGIKAETRVKAGFDNLRGTQATWHETHKG